MKRNSKQLVMLALLAVATGFTACNKEQPALTNEQNVAVSALRWKSFLGTTISYTKTLA